MRLYTFTHFMLSPIAKGIQSGHATVELFTKYEKDDFKKDMLFEWAKFHKTHISLNGGTSPDLLNIYLSFAEICDYPWADFHEDESLGGIRTSISVILPEKIYTTSELLRSKKISRTSNGFNIEVQGDEFFKIRDTFDRFDLTSNDIELSEYISKFKLLGV